MSHDRYSPMPNASKSPAETDARPSAVVVVQVVASLVALVLASQLVFGFLGVRYVHGNIPDYAAPTLAIETLRRVGAIAVFVWLAIGLRRPSRLSRLTGIACISLFGIYCVRAWLTAPVDVGAVSSAAIVAAILCTGTYWLYAFAFSAPAKRFFHV